MMVNIKKTMLRPKKSQGGSICVINQVIRNRFKEIIIESLAKQKEVLMKRERDLDVWGDKERNEFKMLFGRDGEGERMWMLNGIKKMLALNGRLIDEDFEYTEECVYASVNDVVDAKNKIRVGPKFLKAPLEGVNSRVVTLCHEFSHLSEIMNTKDMASPNEGVSYQEYAVKLARDKNRDVMNNAYNIERYFE